MSEKDKHSEQSILSRREFIKRSSAGISLLGLPVALAACGGGGGDDGSDSGSSANSSSSSSSVSSSAGSSSLTATFPTSSSWKFAVMADSQWVTVSGYGDDGENPHSCAVEIINQLNAQFITHGVDFVIQVGDLCDKGYYTSDFTLKKLNDDSTYTSNSTLAEDTRSIFTQALYNAGIGFFPLRGNHEQIAASGTEIQRLFPQTQDGTHNVTPTDVFSITNPDAGEQPFVANSASSFTIGSNFDSPSEGLKGLTYSFDVGNVRFLMLDQFEPTNSTNTDGTSYTDTVDNDSSYDRTMQTQQTWISTRLSGRTSGTHALVLAHKGLVTQDHEDVLFGDCPAAGQVTVDGTTYNGSPEMDTFISSLEDNDVRLFFCGHDHMHDRSKVATMDGTSSVTQIVGASNSNKFYYPATTSNDETFSEGKRQTVISHERNTIGYYIVTVDGDNLTTDFYSAPAYPTSPTGGTIATTPTLGFSWREGFGYGLNGKEFIVSQMASYTAVSDTGPGGSKMSILSGNNGNSANDVAGRAFSVAVNTGWFSATDQTASDVLLLQGMAYTMGSKVTDTYVLSISYDPTKVTADEIAAGTFGLATVQEGVWVNATSANSSGSVQFVEGAWSSDYTLGAWGVDTSSATVWAIIDYNGYFAAVSGLTA